MYMNEEKVKVSIILKYFRELGFQEEELEVETNFKIMIPRQGAQEIENKIAKNVFSDIVYKRKNGDISQNIFLVEVKREGHCITDKDVEQGICYARLLNDMAPFTIVTNGIENRIFDTITKKELKNNISNSSYVKSNYQITLDEELKAEALRIFYGLNASNLINYCKLQREINLKEVMSNVQSDKSIIETLHCDRIKYIDNFYDFLQSYAKIYSIIGRSGIGKTNHIYSIIKKYENEYPILFYNAGLLGKSLENALLSDFNFLLNRDYKLQDLIYRLENICVQTDSTILIFVDGLDENNNRQELIAELNDLAKKFSNKRFRFVFSCKISDDQNDIWYDFTHFKGAINYLGENTYFTKSLEFKGKIGIFIDKLSEDEVNEFWEKYCRYYNTTGEPKGETIELMKEPFMMKIVAESYKDLVLEATISEMNLYKKWIDKKIGYFSDVDLLKLVLCKISEKIIKNNLNTVFYHDVLIDLININDIDKKVKLLINLGILKVTNDKEDNKYLSFVNDNLLFYVYSVLLKKWNIKKIYELESIFNNNIKDDLFRALVFFFISLMQKPYESMNTNWNEKVDANINKECKVCGNIITKDEYITFVYDMKSLIDNTNINSKCFSIAHAKCIPKNFPLIFSKNASFLASCSDLLVIRNIISFLKFTPEKELEKIYNELLEAINISNEINDKYLMNIYPSKEDIGTPFWTLMEMSNNRNTGNTCFQYCDGESILVLFDNKQLAECYLELENSNSNVYSSYQVRGVSGLYEKEILRKLKEENSYALVCVGIENKKSMCIKLYSGELEEICQEQKSVVDYLQKRN
ncbi:type I restriction enzyme HsdR N-terminal domain-containing protein [Clostridium sp.]|uniref:type I restriction enzyme HsdR N-terminal domain-containing protein n=1 Tax=Clostridium sp. TaxID=1506 RepID=UPI0028515E23|nr:type I restriction enzyme HsdR N-terminal domain-containing protein [Clostridium sp.]MDR3597682.1 type I restriction enzyme HsdR N-terminal domain-containing protein [Clostridium sp.]